MPQQLALLLLHGPNLNLLGSREPEIYGRDTLDEINDELVAYAQSKGHRLDCHQSNYEGDLIERIHESFHYDAIVFNPGALMTYGYATRDAIAAVNTPVIEVHLSNVYAREPFRNQSVISAVAVGQISGFGKNSYRLGIEACILFLEQEEQSAK